MMVIIILILTFSCPKPYTLNHQAFRLWHGGPELGIVHCTGAVDKKLRDFL